MALCGLNIPYIGIQIIETKGLSHYLKSSRSRRPGMCIGRVVVSRGR